MAGEHAQDDDPPARSRPWGLCSPFMVQLPISGVVISVVDRSDHRSTVAVTDPVAARWDELELELGTGPLTTATIQSAPQLVGDIDEASMNPIMGAQLSRLGIRALFSFPLTMGLATVGVVGLYRTTSGALSADAVGTALGLARWVTAPAVREALRDASSPVGVADIDTAPGLRREVHQATGMLSAQLDVSASEAFARLRAYAIASDRPITAVALDIIANEIDMLDVG